MGNFSGKFVLRLDPRTHAQLVQRAKEQGVSLNRFCVDLLQRGLKSPVSVAPWYSEGKRALSQLKLKFGANLWAVAAFGSQIQGTAHAHSDLDLLVVLKSSVPIVRSLYGWWEETESPSKMETNPHFIHLPHREQDSSGLLFEIALGCVILYEKKKILSQFLTKLKAIIDSGVITRQFSNGHPYWVWRIKEAS